MPSRLALVIAFLMALAAVSAAAEAPPTTGLPQGIQSVTSVEGIHEYGLANGLRVLLFPDPTKESITVNVTYLVGSAHENYGETGMAHLLEHLLFKGSTNHPNVPDELTSHGSRPNGSTWVDRTNYFETFAASDENLIWALELESDRMVNSFIAQKDLDSEMTVVRNEYEMGENDPEAVLEERITSTAYLWHNYGKSTIGARSDIENVPIDRLQAFYRTWYQPDNAVLVVAGDFETPKTLGLIQKTFGRIPRPVRPLPKLYTQEPAQDGDRSVALRRVGDTQAVSVAYHIPAGSHPDFPAMEILGFILGDQASGRLHKALVETKKVSVVRAWAYQFADPSLFFAGARLRQDQSAADGLAELIAVTESPGQPKTAPTAEEVERARGNLIRDWDASMRNSERAAIGLSEWSAMGDWRLIFLHRDRLRAVTPADVQRVSAAYLRQGNRTTGTYIPTKAAERVEVSATPDVAAMVRDYKGGEGLSEGEDFEATPENIEGRLIRTTLPNGLEVSLLPKKTRGGTVNASLTLQFGDETSLKKMAVPGQLAGELLMRGTQKKSRQQIEDEIARLVARLNVSGGPTEARGQIEVPGANLEGALRLFAEVLQQPAFPASEFDLLKQEMLTEIEKQKSEPGQMAFRAMQRHMDPWPRDDPRYTATPEEEISDLESVTLDQVKGFHADFYGASSGQIAIVGDFDAKAVTALLTELFGSWKSAKPYARLASPYHETASLDLEIETPDKENAVFVAGLLMPLRDDDPDHAALVLGNFMTGGGFLNSRLATRLRQKEGFSYGVRSNLNASRWDQRATFSAFAIHAPQNGEKLEAAFKEEIAKVLDKGFTDEEIAEAKSGLLQQRKVSRSLDRELTGMLAMRDFQNRTLAWDAEQEQKLETLTGDQILAAMRKYFVVEKIAIVRAGDYAKAKEAHSEAVK
jgi:zinc protease